MQFVITGQTIDVHICEQPSVSSEVEQTDGEFAAAVVAALRTLSVFAEEQDHSRLSRGSGFNCSF